MRDNLKNLTEKDYWIYGISESDFDHTVTLVGDLIDARSEQYQMKARQVRRESPDVADDILDDVAYYTCIDNQFLWQFALWRLQGLMESVITYQLIKENGNKLFGLNKKLKALKKKGYSLSNEEYEELLRWAKLRNVISHAPPEQIKPAPIGEQDIVEYCFFVKKLYARWISEKDRLP